eukprot:1159542-Pelagomonas_calceolata.AAC.10
MQDVLASFPNPAVAYAAVAFLLTAWNTALLVALQLRAELLQAIEGPGNCFTPSATLLLVALAVNHRIATVCALHVQAELLQDMQATQPEVTMGLTIEKATIGSVDVTELLEAVKLTQNCRCVQHNQAAVLEPHFELALLAR